MWAGEQIVKLDARIDHKEYADRRADKPAHQRAEKQQPEGAEDQKKIRKEANKEKQVVVFVSEKLHNSLNSKREKKDPKPNAEDVSCDVRKKNG